VRWIRRVWSEGFALFVDDGSLALAVLLWLGACGLLLPHLGVPRAWRAPTLFAGLVLVLAGSALRRAGRRR
jgi:hypothetical protein